ncbi:MAG: molybdopterin converting factor subunit 1 [Betaproteobacteria bacterium]|nr:MAG: molybdopterin converting factor subunit 1 [Betaproteobacteria bacterium]
MVRLVYLARLRDAFGTAAESVDLPGNVGNVTALLEWLARRGEPWTHELAPGRAVRVAVNHDIAGPGTPIRSGDEIALFPPVTGG